MKFYFTANLHIHTYESLVVFVMHTISTTATSLILDLNHAYFLDTHMDKKLIMSMT